ncbi:hypothetical protein [Massilia timonae]|uniref:hypothetical protein n=1 Tax=Massilia timonae TaxID=47229 RepID=UPI002896C81B|nr:hypothetical protein [Massilia timonae]
MTHMTLQAVRQLIANDSYAITFQSVEQYRATLLRHVDSLVDGTQHYASGGTVPAELRLVGEGLRPLTAPAAQQAAAPGALDADAAEGVELLDTLIDNIEKDGPYSSETTLTFLNQIRQCFTAPGTPEAPAENRHPLQPLVEDARGTVRFKANAIIVHLTRDKLNDLASMDFSTEDREQLAQLIGYSLGGFAELSYVTDETYDRAAAQPVVPRAAQLDGGQGEGTKS